MPSLIRRQGYKKNQAASSLHDVATAVKSGESLDVSHDPKAPKQQVDDEKADLNHVLDKLNLAAVNNKAFSFSEKSNQLMQEFVQVLKDIINGVPTAYNDLENLLTRSDKDLREMFDKMPPFLQKLIKSLPTKMSATVLPGLMAAASEKPGADGQRLNVSSGAPKSKSRSKRSIPSLKSLAQGDVAVTMLRSILNFLKLRFPALLSGANILVSLAVFCTFRVARRGHLSLTLCSASFRILVLPQARQRSKAGQGTSYCRRSIRPLERVRI
jgi:hypothetical protein